MHVPPGPVWTCIFPKVPPQTGSCGQALADRLSQTGSRRQDLADRLLQADGLSQTAWADRRCISISLSRTGSRVTSCRSRTGSAPRPKTLSRKGLGSLQMGSLGRALVDGMARSSRHQNLPAALLLLLTSEAKRCSVQRPPGSRGQSLVDSRRRFLLASASPCRKLLFWPTWWRRKLQPRRGPWRPHSVHADGLSGMGSRQYTW